MGKIQPAGITIDRYEVEAEVARGGMGLVYRCYDPLHKRRVALKLMAAHLSDNDNALARFRREAALVASLKHTHIATFYELGDYASRPYFVMEWVDGRTLKEELATHQKLPLGRCLSLFAQLADAIGYAHAHGVVHRDLKPANIIIGPNDHTTIVDFGVALLDTAPSLTTTGLIVGTPLYMSPEQMRGQDLDGRSDQYSLAIILYEMLTGQFPYESIRVPAIYHQQMTGLPIPITERDPHISTAIEAALLRAMAKDPAQRFETMADFNQALRRRTVRKTSPRRESPYLTPEPGWQQTFTSEITAVFASNGSPIFVATADGAVVALSGSGERLWQAQADGRITHLIHQADVVMGMTAVGTLYAWRATDGSPLWQYTAEAVPHLVHWLNGLVALVLPDGKVFYLHPQDGSLVKRIALQTGQPVTAVPAFSGDQLLLAAGNVLSGYSTPPKDDV